MSATQDLIKTLKQLRSNVKTLHRFARGTEAERAFHHERTRRGKNFVVMKWQGGLIFSPSKFSGYPDNSLHHLAKLHVRDGRKTDRRIDSLIPVRVRPGEPGYRSLEQCYRAYCSAHEIAPTAHPRTFWRLG